MHIYTDKDPSLRIEIFAIIAIMYLRCVSTKLNLYCYFLPRCLDVAGLHENIFPENSEKHHTEVNLYRMNIGFSE